MKQWSRERLARAALSHICEPAKPGLARLVEEQGAEQVYQGLRALGDDSAWARRAAALDVSDLMRAAEHCGLRLVVPGDQEWPSRLADLDRLVPVGEMSGSAIALWAKGPARLDELCEDVHRPVAIVGARSSTRYGEAVATELAARLSGEFPVISGGAYGIDIAAHRGALAAGGTTVAVMAGGLDAWYPRGNSAVLDRITRQGLVISELAPGIRPTRAGFLARNRLIAALGVATVVVEAAARSGALNTAHWTTALSRVLAAVPGPVSSALSETPHRLIRDAEAVLVTGADDVRALITPVGEQDELPLVGRARELDDLDPTLLAVREALPARGEATFDEISVASGIGVAACQGALVRLELAGLVSQPGPGRWRLMRPGCATTQ
ncbi:DNA processing protein [Propionibacterium cyclohexanicum]|uniref:DNA processing protein n=1 Tax=Propionibacterium cyclohexanicum TaxID=64702 RepID=A0A1H9PQX9_9ACTN|nr:DNA-processing protein DprA [Propionibacterium cyclohexanicum]SER50736.1 DNA processing protein [Propionibacterium cyclohexanicum]